MMLMKMMMDDGIPSRLHYERNVIQNARMSLLKKRSVFPTGPAVSYIQYLLNQLRRVQSDQGIVVISAGHAFSHLEVWSKERHQMCSLQAHVCFARIPRFSFLNRTERPIDLEINTSALVLFAHVPHSPRRFTEANAGALIFRADAQIFSSEDDRTIGTLQKHVISARAGFVFFQQQAFPPSVTISGASVNNCANIFKAFHED